MNKINKQQIVFCSCPYW